MKLSAIRDLSSRPGPWASVYLDATAVEPPLAEGRGGGRDGRHLLNLRWREMREDLRARGADEATLHAIDDVVGRSPLRREPAELAIFAAHGKVGLAHTLRMATPRPTAAWGPMAHTADLVRGWGERVRWVRANVDRTGAWVATDEEPVIRVEGPESFPITKVSTGEWEMPQIQRAAEVTWDRNSAQVAQQITESARRVGADVIVLSGDVHARRLVLEHLPVALAARVRQLEHAVPTRSVSDPMDANTRDAVESVQQQIRSDAVDRFANGLSTGDSIRGVEPVTDAAREQRIETLVLGPEPSQRWVWVDPANPTMVGLSKRDTGTEAAVQEPADDALLMAAALAGADSVVISADADLIDSVGATVRYPPDYPYPPPLTSR